MDAKEFKIQSLIEKRKITQKYEGNPFSICYHGIDLIIQSPSEEFIKSLASHLPPSWQNKDSLGQKIIFLPPPEEATLLWEDAPSPDCEQWASEHGHMALQRDFVALIDPQNIIWVMTPLKIDDGFFNSMRWILSQRLLAQNKTVLHSSAVSVMTDGDEAYIFMGKSGAGKTTIAAMADDRLVLGDDMNILEASNHQLYIEAARLGQRIQNPKTYEKKFKVRKIFCPVQDTRNFIVPIPQHEVGLKIISSMANIFWPNQDKQVISDSLKLVEQIKKLGNFYYLHFTRSKEFWHVLD